MGASQQTFEAKGGNTVQYRNLGGAGVKVSPIILGTAFFGTRVEEDAAISIIDAALDAGINVIDTANSYTDGRSEEIIGATLKGRRDRVVLASKVHFPRGEGPNDRGNSRYHITNQVEISLRRLQTDHIDLYQVHRPDRTTPIEESLRTLDDLRQQGKIVYYGTSSFPAWQLCEALWTSNRLGLAPIVSEQPSYSLLRREVETEVLPVCREYGLATILYSPLAGGWLSGKYRRNDPPPADSRLGSRGVDLAAPEHARTLDATEALQKIASAKGKTLSQLSLAWLLAQPGVTSTIIGPRILEQLQDNLGALDVTITDEDRTAIDRIVPPETTLV